MNSTIKRISAAAAALMITAASCLPLASGAGLSFGTTDTAEKSGRLFRKQSDASFSCDIPQFIRTGESGESITPIAKCTPVTMSAVSYEAESSFPESFDLRDMGKVSAVKDQGVWGTCWAHSSASSAESDIIDAVPEVNLSEFHTSYMSYYGDDQIDSEYTDTDDVLNYGGSSYVVANLWSQWYGPVLEKRLPYGDIDFFDDKTAVSDMQKQSDFHLENAYLLEFDDQRRNFDELNAAVKQFIYSGNAVDVSFCSDSQYYNSVHSSYYTDRKSRFANHAVTIVGWDDNFPAKNFNSEAPGDGAWLVKNSWGADYGESGYIWISYYNNTLCNFAVYELGDKTEYTYNLHHDTFVPTQSLSAYDTIDEIRPSYMANVFDVETDMQLEAVSVYFMNPDTEYEITVYSDLADPTDPSSGTASAVTKGSNSLTGYVTVELDENVIVKKGTKVGVSVKMYCDDTPFVIPVETCMTAVDEDDGEIIDLSAFTSHERIEANTSENQSFYSEDGISWTDITESDFVYNQATEDAVLSQIIDQLYDDLRSNETKLLEEADTLKAFYTDLFERSEIHVLMGNITLKALGNPVNTVDFSHISGQVAADEAVELSVKDGKPIYVSLNGGAFNEYTAPIKITEKMTVSATTDYINISERTYTPAKAQFNDLCYISGSNLCGTAERISESEYLIRIELYKDDISLLPVTSAEIIMNGQTIESGVYGERFELPYGETVFVFSLSEEGKLDNEVTVRVLRSPVAIDLEHETMTCRSDAVVMNSSGKVLSSGSYIGSYAGETLTATVDGETYEIEVPSRAVVPELEIDYFFETLGFIPNDLAELLAYSTKENPSDSDYISASSRLIDGTWINSGMVMNKAFRIIPGEVITFKLKAGNGCFKSAPSQYHIPDCGEAPREIVGYTINNKGGFVFDDYSMELAFASETSDADFESMADGYGYDAEEFAALMTKRFGAESNDELLSYIGSEWLFGSEPVNSGKLIIRYAATDSSFASAGRIIDLTGMGDVDRSGKVEAFDAALVLEHYAALAAGGAGVIEEDRIKASDMDFDGKITASDASRILEMYALLASSGDY